MDLKFFFFQFYLWISRVVLKTWVGGRLSYFVSSVLRGIGDVFLLDCPQVLSMLNIESKGIFILHKSSIKGRKFYGELCGVVDPIPKIFVGKVIGY